jgi:multicomponent Na+:H+ antiporter subunit B
VKLIGEILIFIALGLIFFNGIDATLVPSSTLRDHFVTQGVKETGAINLVSSIYLGYRAFDTLGETIVLLVAVSGIIMLLGTRK